MTTEEVRKARDSGVGCCNRWADRHPCNCLEDAERAEKIADMYGDRDEEVIYSITLQKVVSRRGRHAD